MVNVGALNTLWKQYNAALIGEFNDKATLYYAPTVSSVSTDYSSYYQGSLNYLAPTTVTISGSGSEAYTMREIYGEAYLNLEGWQYNRGEELQTLPVGAVQPGDALFIALAEDVYINGATPAGGDYFEGCDYVILEKSGQKYVNRGIYPCGLDDIHSVYVLLRQADKAELEFAPG